MDDTHDADGRQEDRDGTDPAGVATGNDVYDAAGAYDNVELMDRSETPDEVPL